MQYVNNLLTWFLHLGTFILLGVLFLAIFDIVSDYIRENVRKRNYMCGTGNEWAPLLACCLSAYLTCQFYDITLYDLF